MDSDPPAFDEMILDQVRFPGRNIFELFQETIASLPVRCSFEYSGKDPFHTQWVATQSAGAVAIRWSCAAHTTKRTESDIANSPPSGYAALYALSGGARIIQDGRRLSSTLEVPRSTISTGPCRWTCSKRPPATS